MEESRKDETHGGKREKKGKRREKKGEMEKAKEDDRDNDAKT